MSCVMSCIRRVKATPRTAALGRTMPLSFSTSSEREMAQGSSVILPFSTLEISKISLTSVSR